MTCVSPRRPQELRVSDVPELILSPDIRVELDRATLIRLDPTIRVLVGRIADLADRIYPPWYYGANGRISHDDPTAVPKPISELVACEDFDDRHSVGPLVLPCYALPEGELCLDGNHRLSAALRFNPGLTIVLLSVEGPVERAILPDLRFWEEQSRAAEPGKTIPH